MRIIFTLMGFVSLILGVVGIMLPVVPTVPFLFVAYWSFRRSSARFNNWYVKTGIHKYYIRCVRKIKATPLKYKIICCIAAAIFFCCLLAVWIYFAPAVLQLLTKYI